MFLEKLVGQMRMTIASGLFGLVTIGSVVSLNEIPQDSAWLPLLLQGLAFVALGWALDESAWLLAGTVLVPAAIAEPFGDPGWGSDGGPPLVFVEIAFAPAYLILGIGSYLMTQAHRSRSGHGSQPRV